MCYLSPSRNLANIYLFKVKNRNTRKRCVICSDLSIKTTEQLGLRWEFKEVSCDQSSENEFPIFIRFRIINSQNI